MSTQGHAAILFTALGLSTALLGGALAQDLPTPEQFQSLLTTCALGSDVSIDADIIGSATSIYRGERTKGTAKLKTESGFLALFPEKDRLEAVKLYRECVRDFLNRPSRSTDPPPPPPEPRKDPASTAAEFMRSRLTPGKSVDELLAQSSVPFCSYDIETGLQIFYAVSDLRSIYGESDPAVDAGLASIGHTAVSIRSVQTVQDYMSRAAPGVAAEECLRQQVIYEHDYVVGVQVHLVDQQREVSMDLVVDRQTGLVKGGFFYGR
jgi:hypothetical protein